MNKWQVFASASCALLVTVGARAAEETATGLDYVLRLGATYTDNIFAAPSPLEEGSTAIAFGGELRGERPTGRLRYDAAMELMYYQYLDTFEGGQLYGRGKVLGSYDFFPDHFSWNLGVDFDQLSAQILQPTVPGNVEDVITLSTGPTIRGELFGAIDTELDAHYIRAIYTGDSFDNDTVGGRLQLGRRTGPRTRFGVGASLDDVTYESGLVSSTFDYQRREAFLYGEAAGVRTTLSAELGYSEAEGESFNGDGPLARVRLTRQISPALTGYLGYRQEFPTSQVTRLVSDPTPGGGGVIDTSLVTSSPRETHTGEIGFRYLRTRSEADIGFYHVEDKSLIVALGDHSYDELRAHVTRHFTPRSHGTVLVSYSKEDFSAFSQTYDVLTAGFEYGHDFTRSIGLDLRLRYRTQDSNNNLNDYDELLAGVFLRYTGSLLGRTTATLPDDEIR